MGNTAIEKEIESTIRHFFRAMDHQDYDLMERVLARDNEMVHIGTDKEEIWKGWEELWDATEQQFSDLEHYKAKIRALNITVSNTKRVAWYSHLLDADIKSGKSRWKWEGARFTGVLEKRKGLWKLVQTHVSIPESG